MACRGGGSALAAASGAHAADAIVAAEPEPLEYVRICDAYGVGYFYIPGTDTCLKIGGQVRTEGEWHDAYNPNSKVGTLSSPNLGEFKDGRGVLIGQDTLNDKAILVRVVWSDIKPDSHHYEESYSNDGGTTWATSFIANLTRLKQ